MSDIVAKNNKPLSILPACKISGDESTVELRVELPGVHKDDIELRIDNDQLIISAKQSEESANGNWLLRERRRGNYERRFTIDNTIDRDHIDAVYKMGIITISLRVKDEVKPRRIAISAS